jgi:plastocyanin
MKQKVLAFLGLATSIAFLIGGAPALADDNAKQSVTVAFGGGLNTAQPGNVHNHVVLPKQIKVKLGGVVNFVVAGFHQVTVYQSGTRPENIVVPAAPALFINDDNNLFYRGPSPAGPPPPGLSNTANRVESVRFEAPGTYLVICNVRPHFLDGMFAFIKVTNDD